MKDRIYLSLAHMGGHERNYAAKALEDNWVTTIGPNVDGFERDLCEYTRSPHAVALSSGTAAIHLGLQVLGVTKGDEVLCSSFTFVASANPILYLGATPVFIDSEPDTWNMNPDLLEEAIKDRIKKTGKRPRAIVLVHLYGMPARLKEIIQVATRYEIPVLEDAAEALGSTYQRHQLGTFGNVGVYSFNGNKIITTSGGGALVSAQRSLAEKARFLSMQARDEAPVYQHTQMGYNYRLSNVCAGIGRGQMEVLAERVKQRRAIFAYYRKELGKLDGIYFQPELPESVSNRWLTCLLLDPEEGLHRDEIIQALAEENIEARPLWKPMHQQPLFEGTLFYGSGVCTELFEHGVCLPSGTGLSEEDLGRVTKVLKEKHTEARRELTS